MIEVEISVDGIYMPLAFFIRQKDSQSRGNDKYIFFSILAEANNRDIFLFWPTADSLSSFFKFLYYKKTMAVVSNSDSLVWQLS